MKRKTKETSGRHIWTDLEDGNIRDVSIGIDTERVIGSSFHTEEKST
jgi:hypothetical protein